MKWTYDFPFHFHYEIVSLFKWVVSNVHLYLAAALPSSNSRVFCRHTVGDSKVPFCLQSCVKPLKYAIAVNDYGTEYVHSFIGKEPSGLRFNKLSLNEDGEPPFFICSISKCLKSL